jgi:hypothetical protein
VRLLLILKKRKKLFKFFFKICFGSKGLPAITAFNKRITTIIPAVPEDKLKEATSRFVAIIRKQRLKLKKKQKKNVRLLFMKSSTSISISSDLGSSSLFLKIQK